MVASTNMADRFKGAMGQYKLANKSFNNRAVWEKPDNHGNHYLWHNFKGQVTWMVSF